MYMEETWHDKYVNLHTKCWYVAMSGLAKPLGGIRVPRGAGNLKALRTLGEVDIGSCMPQVLLFPEIIC